MMKNFLHRVIKMFLIRVSQKRPKASSREEVLIKIFRATNLMHQINLSEYFCRTCVINFGRLMYEAMLVRSF